MYISNYCKAIWRRKSVDNTVFAMIAGGHYEVVAAKKVLQNVPINELPPDNDELVAMAWRDMPFEMICELGKDIRSVNNKFILTFSHSLQISNSISPLTRIKLCLGTWTS